MKATNSGSFATETFLKQENRELRQQVTELRELLEHNKNALRASINYTKEPSPDDDKPYQKLINHLYRENDYLKEQLKMRHSESNEANSQILFNQKLVQASEDYERSLVDDLKEKIAALKLDIKHKQERIDELQRQKPQFDNDNMLHVKIVEVTTPQTLSLRFHDEIEALRQIVIGKDEQINKEKQNREELYRLNLALTKQINELKSYGYDRSTQSKDLPSRSPNHDMNKYLDCTERCYADQRKMYDEDHSASDESMSSDEPNEHLLDNININASESKPKGKPIPKLQLRKAKEIQEIIVKKINLEEKKKHKTHTETAAKTEELTNLKKNLNREVLRNLELSRTIDRLKRISKTLEQQNHILTKKISGLKSSDRDDLHTSQTHDHRPMLERTHIQELLNVGRDVYLNENIEQAIEGRIEPQQWARGRSNSFSL